MSGAGIGNIYLAGLMGSGKSSLGPLLAQRMGRRFIDLDEAICAEAGHSLHDLVAAEGWLGGVNWDSQSALGIIFRPRK